MLRVTLLAAVLLLGGAPSVAASDPRSGSMQGTVLTPEGDPLANVSVSIYAEQPGVRRVTTTSATGVFDFDDLPTAGYRVCFDAARAVGGTSSTGYADRCWRDFDPHDQRHSYDPSSVDVVQVGEASDARVDQVLPTAGGVQGTVADTEGALLAGAVVSLIDLDEDPSAVRDTVVTTTDGTYRFDRIRPGGRYTVCAGDLGDVTGGSSTTGYLDRCLGGGLARASGRGRVPDEIPPQTDATVLLPWAAGSYAAADPVVLPAAGSIAGRVVDAAGRAVAGIRVRAVSADGHEIGTATTDRSGRYVVDLDAEDGVARTSHDTRLAGARFDLGFDEPVPTGDRRFLFGYAQGVATTPGRTTILETVLVRAASAAGTVRDERGRTVAGANVIVTKRGHAEVTSSDGRGRYRAVQLPAGTYTACAETSSLVRDTPYGLGYVDACSGGSPLGKPQRILVRTGQHRNDVHLRVTRGAGVAGFVTPPEGEEEPQPALVVARRTDGLVVYGHLFSTDHGHYRMVRLPAGRYTICVDPVRDAFATSCIGDAGGTRKPQLVTLVPGRLVRGLDLTQRRADD